MSNGIRIGDFYLSRARVGAEASHKRFRRSSLVLGRVPYTYFYSLRGLDVLSRELSDVGPLLFGLSEAN